ncbi:MAG: lasso peptide biosynthesis B2 protein [Glaciecola sp.]
MHKLWVLYLAFWGFAKWYVLVRFVPFAYWRKRLLTRCLPHAIAMPKLDFTAKMSARSLIDLSEKVARHHPTHVNCLRRCMVQYELLSRYGYPVQLYIGVRFTPDKSLQAHSWLLCEGLLINDAPEIVNTYTQIANVGKFFAGRTVGMMDS